MTPPPFMAIVPVLLGVLVAPPAFQQVTRLVSQEEVILRVPVQPRPSGGRIEWVEHKAPKCVPAALIRGAVLSGPEKVDFILAGRERVRAKVDEDCPALDFYGGFYLQPEDERICAGRDSIHSRMGGSCEIKKFKRLEPKIAR